MKTNFTILLRLKQVTIITILIIIKLTYIHIIYPTPFRSTQFNHYGTYEPIIINLFHKIPFFTHFSYYT